MNEQPFSEGEIPDELQDFAAELKTLTPWTPPVVVIRSETNSVEKRRISAAWKTLLIGLALGILFGSGTVASVWQTPKTVEVVRYVEVAAPKPQPAREPIAEKTTIASENRIPESAAPFEVEAMIESCNDRAKLVARIAAATAASGSGYREPIKLSDDPNTVFRLRESFKL